MKKIIIFATLIMIVVLTMCGCSCFTDVSVLHCEGSDGTCHDYVTKRDSNGNIIEQYETVHEIF